MIDSEAKAIRWATGTLAGEGGNGLMVRVAHVTSVSYVRTTARAAYELVQNHPEPTVRNDLAWLFVEYGAFRQSGFGPLSGKRFPLLHTLWIIVEPGPLGPADPSALTDRCFDLSRLGVVHAIMPGQVPQIDAKRAPGSTGALPSSALWVGGVACPATNATAIAETPTPSPVPPTVAAIWTVSAATARAATPVPWPPTAAAAATWAAETIAAGSVTPAP